MPFSGQDGGSAPTLFSIFPSFSLFVHGGAACIENFLLWVGCL